MSTPSPARAAPARRACRPRGVRSRGRPAPAPATGRARDSAPPSRDRRARRPAARPRSRWRRSRARVAPSRVLSAPGPPGDYAGARAGCLSVARAGRPERQRVRSGTRTRRPGSERGLTDRSVSDPLRRHIGGASIGDLTPPVDDASALHGLASLTPIRSARVVPPGPPHNVAHRPGQFGACGYLDERSRQWQTGRAGRPAPGDAYRRGHTGSLRDTQRPLTLDLDAAHAACSSASRSRRYLTRPMTSSGTSRPIAPLE